MATDPRLGTYFQQLEQQHRLPAGFLGRTRYIESANGTRLKSPTGPEGPFQFTRKTATAMGLPLDQRMNEQASAAAAARLAAQNMSILQRKLGRAPNGAELYMAHQQGGPGAANLLANPNAAAGSLTDPNNIRVNAGDPSAPARSILAKFEQRYNNAKPDVAVPPLPAATEIATRPIAGQITDAPAIPVATAGVTGEAGTATPAVPAKPMNATLLDLLTKPEPTTMGDVKGFLQGNNFQAGMKGLGQLAAADAKAPVYAEAPRLDTTANTGDPSLLAAIIAKRKAEQAALLQPRRI